MRWFKQLWSSSKAIQALVSLAIVCLLAGEQMGLWPSQVLQRLEWLSYDQRVINTLSAQQDPSIIIVDIDEESLQQIGQWPWPRAQVAQLIFSLFEDYDIQLLGLDVIFAEAEANLLELQWQQLREQYPGLPETHSLVGGDNLLGQVLMNYPVVSAFYFEQAQPQTSTRSTGVLPPPLIINNPAESWQQLPLPSPARFTSNSPSVQSFVLSGGYFDNPMVDADGVFRRVPLMQQWQNELYGSLPLAMLYTLLGQPPVELDIFSGGGQLHLEGIDVGGFYFPTDPTGAVLVPWAGRSGHFQYIPAASILLGTVDPAQLAGKIVLLGTSAAGLMDLR